MLAKRPKLNGSPRRAVLALLAGAAGTALSGCAAIIGAGAPPRLFRLSSKNTFPEDVPKVDWQLVVEPASAPASINSNRIGLMESEFRFNYYADANWVDRAPVMVQKLIIESFDNSKGIVGVGPESIGLRPDFVLKPELREFQAHSEGANHNVIIVINARLVQLPERKIVAVANFSRTESVPAGELGPVINAFDNSLGKVMKRLVIWTLEEGEKVWQEGLATQKRAGRRTID
ncbi:MAG: ABC-type transport auxiliary lipoprotein family protein [Alphaproteobacteria bacterium]|jgi:cholesterol transport system auxiliary component